jgi:branched-chain amino acid transport system substrate-binding protein
MERVAARFMSIVSVLSLVVTAACTAPAPQAAQGSTPAPAAVKIKVGAITVLSGPAAYIGVAHQNSLKAAETIMNADPAKYLGAANRSITFDVREAGAEVQQATALAQTFANDQSYLAISGPGTSPQALSLGPLAQQLKMPLVIPFSPSTGLTDPGEYIFKLATSNDVLASLVIPRVNAQFKIKNAGVIYNTDNQANLLSGQAAIEGFKKEGIQVTPFTLPFTSNDYTQAISEMQSANVEAIWFSTTSSGAVSAINEANRKGFHPVWIGGPLVGDRTVVDEAGALVADKLVFASDYDRELDTPLAKEFRAQYKDASSKDADQYAADGFTSALVLAAAIKAIPGDQITRTQIATEMAKLNSIDVVLGDGKLGFDSKRQAKIVPALFKIGSNGTVQPFK